MLFAAPLGLFYNTVWEPKQEIKYLLFGLCLVVSFAVVATRPSSIRIPLSFYGWTIASLVLCIGYAMNPGRDLPTMILFMFSIAVAWAGFLTLPRIEPGIVLIALTISLSMILAQIWLAFDLLAEPLSRDKPIGTLTFDSYPIFGMIAGVSGLLFLHYRRSILAWIGLAMTAYVFLNGQSRGELLAFVAVATLMVFPRLSFVLLPLAAVGLWFAVLLSDLPIFERLRIGLEVGFDRAQLFEDAFSLMGEGWTFWTGLGINGYQDALGLVLSSYPHNSALEAILSGGIVYLLLYFVLFVWPVFKGAFQSDRDARIMWAIPAFMLLLSLKSFSIFTNWPLMFFLPMAFLIRRGLRKLPAADT